MIKSKIKISILLFIADASLSYWSYLKLSDYGEFKKMVKAYITSPDMLLQMYNSEMKTLSTGIFIFLALHLLLYSFYAVYAVKNSFASRYLRAYSFLAALSAFLLMISGVFLTGLCSFLAYSTAFISIHRLNRK